MNIQNIKQILLEAFKAFAFFRSKNEEIRKKADHILAEAMERGDAEKIKKVKKNIDRLS
ncbi:MAG: hypothetical protein WC862_02945 [Patescibacteria group bacterium]